MSDKSKNLDSLIKAVKRLVRRGSGTDSAAPESSEPVGGDDAPRGLSRRHFISTGLSGVAVLSFSGFASPPKAEAIAGGRILRGRRARIENQRIRSARRAARIRLRAPQRSGDENAFEQEFSYTKVLQKDQLGEASNQNYRTLKRALRRGRMPRFENTLFDKVGPKGFKNPLAAHAMDLEGIDGSQIRVPRPPSITSAWNSAEMAELYWQALCRDVHFSDYWSSSLISDAALDLSSSYSDFRGPRVGSDVTPDTIFRGFSAGELVGPYISQFLLLDVVSGTLSFEQKQRTVLAGSDFMTRYDFWRFRQGGSEDGFTNMQDPTRRYIRNGRDLAAYVQIDRVHQPFLNAFAILFDNLEAPQDSGNPYLNSFTMDGFITFEYAHIMPLLGEVCWRALKACWYHKWLVHMRIRPEEFGGRIHNMLSGNKNYPINEEILNSPVLPRIFEHNENLPGPAGGEATYLLPQAFPEGCPNHPAYPSGHATIAGACVTVLKAFFNEDYVIPNPVVASADGTALEPYNGAGSNALTVRGELNKLAMNIAMARNWAGIHWRSDLTAGLELGERMAIFMMREQNRLLPERPHFTLTKFDGSVISVR